MAKDKARGKAGEPGAGRAHGGACCYGAWVVGAALYPLNRHQGSRRSTRRARGRPGGCHGGGDGHRRSGVTGRDRGGVGTVLGLIVRKPLTWRTRTAGQRLAQAVGDELGHHQGTEAAGSRSTAAPPAPPGIAAAATHHGFVLSALSAPLRPSCAGRDAAGRSFAQRPVDVPHPATSLITGRYPEVTALHPRSQTAGQPLPRRRRSCSSHFRVSRGWV